MKEKTKDIFSSAKETIKDKRENNATGKFLTKTILVSNDQVLGHRGEMVTHKLINDARRFGVEDQVYGNITENPRDLTS